MNSFPTWPHHEPDELQAVNEVLSSGKVNYWTGEQTKTFEREFASYHQRNFGIALANGTLALELALIAFGIGPGDEVITTCRTFIASASCIVRVGATPILADVDLDSQNITAASIEPLIGPQTKAIICVHLAGWPCDMPAILALAQSKGIRVIEDCAQAHGAKIAGRVVGSFGDAAAFSFCQDKIMSTGGEGGILILDDEQAFKRAWAFKDHGKGYDVVFHKEHPPGFRWLHQSFGTNWRFTEMQSAIARIQLRKLSLWVEKRNLLAKRLIAKLEQSTLLRIPVPTPDLHHAYYRVYAFVRPQHLALGWDRDRIMMEVGSRGVPCFSGSCGEIYREEAFRQSGLGPKTFLPQAKELADTSLCFLVHPTLAEADIDQFANAILEVLNLATKANEA